MRRSAKSIVWLAAASTLLSWGSSSGWGLGPHNILVITSQRSPEGLAVANYYRERRGIPPINVVRTRLPAQEVVRADVFERAIVEIAQQHIRRYGLEDRIDAWVTTAEGPIIIDRDNSVSGVVFFGKLQSPSADAKRVGTYSEANRYYESMNGWHRPRDAKTGGYLHMRLDAGSLELTRRMIDRSLEADGTFPEGKVYLFDGEGARSSRKEAIEPALRFLEMLGVEGERRTGWQLSGAKDVLGWQTGIVRLNASANEYVPGALADHLTSFGGRQVLYRGQTPARDFLKAGCSATYGTVVEPYNFPAKFPLPQVYAYYACGFTAVESYWMSVHWPQQGLFQGDPLTRPFQKAPKIDVSGISPEGEVRGTFDVEVTAETEGPGGGVRKIDVFVDGQPVHKRVFTEVPADTTLTLSVASKSVSVTSKPGEPFGDFALRFGVEVTQAGLPASIKPGLVMLALPSIAAAKESFQVTSSSPLVTTEILGTSGESGAKPAESASGDVMAWRLDGVSGTGDRLTLTIREGEKVLATTTYEIGFPRSAASACTAFWLDASEKMPKGYQLKTELDAQKPLVAGLRLMTAPGVSRGSASATLTLKKAKDSKLSVAGPGGASGPSRALATGEEFVAVRLGLGPTKLRTRAQVETLPLADGRHMLEVIAYRGTAPDASSRRAIPIIVRNADRRLKVEVVQDTLSLKRMGPAPVAKVVRSPGMPGEIRFFVNDNEIPPQEVQGDTLSMDASLWGEGTHFVSARLIEKDKEVLRSDNEILVRVEP